MLSVLAALALTQSTNTFALADVDITPPEPLPLGGYTERHGEIMAGVGDRLHARALCLRVNRLPMVIVSVETLTIPESLVREVRKRVQPQVAGLLLCATHTHCAPDSQMLNDRMTIAIPGIAVYRPRWLNWYADKIASAVNSALKAQGTAFRELRVKTWQSDVNRGRRKGAKPDKTATILYADAHPLFFEYAAHGTFYDADENMTRGDWPGKVTRVAPMALIGPIGDVSPKAPGKDKAVAAEKIATFWSTLEMDERKARVETVWKGQARTTSWEMEPIPLGPKQPHPEFQPRSLGKILVNKFAPSSAAVNGVRLGKLAIIAIPGEPTSHIGNAIVEAGRKLGFSDVLVLSHANGWMGYILLPDDYDAGGYEASLSFYGREEGNKVLRTCIQVVDDFAGEPKVGKR